MKRSVLALDRIVVLLLGLVLLLAGAAAVAWGAGWLTSLWPQAPEQVDPTPGTGLFQAPWLGAALLAAGVLAGVLGLWWLVAHRSHHKTGLLRLPGSDRTGRLTLDGSSATDVTADQLTQVQGVRSGKGRLIDDRGQLLADIDLTVEPDADLTTVLTAIDDTMADLASVLGRDDVHARVTLHVARNAHQQARVN